MLKKRKKKRRISWLVVIACLFGVFVLLLFLPTLYNYIDDTLRARNFEPSKEIESYTQHLSLTEQGERLLRASYPQIENKEDFNTYCANEKQEYVLGCYLQAEKEIKLYDVPSEELNGIMESTLAHELLHAVWARLDLSTQEALQPLMDEVLKNYPTIQEELQNYEAIDYYDELHARLGTEVKQLPTELEEHYATYFKDQDAIVSYTDAYQEPLNKLNEEMDALEKEITSKQTELEARDAALVEENNQLNADIDAFNGCANTPDCFTQEAFDYQHALLQARITEFENKNDQLTFEFEELNRLIERYNAMVIKGEKLNHALNSNFNETPIEN